MRFLVMVGVVALCLAGAALGQEAPPRMTYTWDQRPNARAFAVHFPRGALRERVQGAATLCCRVTEDRRLDCSAPVEWPAGYGFGQASITISRDFLMSEASYASVRGDPNHIVRQTIRWGIPDVPLGELPPAFREAARSACDGAVAPTS